MVRRFTNLRPVQIIVHMHNHDNTIIWHSLPSVHWTCWIKCNQENIPNGLFLHFFVLKYAILPQIAGFHFAPSVILPHLTKLHQPPSLRWFIIKSEVSTFPILITFFRDCVAEMFVTSYSVTYWICVPGKPGICFHYHCAVYDECKYLDTFWLADRTRLFVQYTISLSSLC